MAQIDRTKTNGTDESLIYIAGMMLLLLTQKQLGFLQNEYKKENCTEDFSLFVVSKLKIQVVEKENLIHYNYVSTNYALQENEKYHWIGMAISTCLTSSQYSRMTTLFNKNGGFLVTPWWKYVLTHVKITVEGDE